MQKIEYKVSFNTPAFLGNAAQQAQWRTPPFKALLRQWWRVVKAREFNYDHRAMREEEGRLFGHAWLERDKPNGGKETWASQSQVRIRITPWDTGKLSTSAWPGGPMDQVVTTRDGRGPRADVYLGYGPVLPPNRREGRGIEIRGAIGTNEHAELRLGCPSDKLDDLKNTLALMQAFGALGSRERNGWGSLVLEPNNQTSIIPSLKLAQVSSPWKSCLDRDWAHAIGVADDGNPLIWQTSPQTDWRKAMGALAKIKVAVRMVAKGFADPNGSGTGGIHLLGYPAGEKWQLRSSGPNQNDFRLASQLRFKVMKHGSHFIGIIVHLPCGLPNEFVDKLDERSRAWFGNKQNHLLVWSAVHKELNARCKYWNGMNGK
jgi:CRISPR-associated protein Cmr1